MDHKDFINSFYVCRLKKLLKQTINMYKDTKMRNEKIELNLHVFVDKKEMDVTKQIALSRSIKLFISLQYPHHIVHVDLVNLLE